MDAALATKAAQTSLDATNATVATKADQVAVATALALKQDTVGDELVFTSGGVQQHGRREL